MKLFTAVFASFILLFTAGCASKNIVTDRDRVASAALTYESALDGLIAARKSGLIDDDAYRKIDPVVDVASSMLKALKARVDEGETVSEDTFDRLNKVLDAVLDVLLQYNASQSRIDEVQNMKIELQTLRMV